MANKYKGTQTEKNLLEAFAGESQARNKYTYFASRAKRRMALSRSLPSSWRQQTTRKSMQRCGSRSWRASATQLQT